MINNTRKRYSHVLLVLVLLAAVLMGGTASAATYNLCTGQTVMTMADGQPVTVWGLGLDPSGTGACNPTIPGPVLRVAWDDPALIVNLRNTLTEPVSLHILGQQLSNNAGPVWDGGVTGARPDLTSRVRSFTHEAAGGGGTAQYQWNSLRPGTFALMSGTNPAKQVQMGISAAVIKDAALGVAYADNPNIPGDQSVPYNQELILVFQEIDPAIHAAVAAGTYGPGGTITSSIYREPRYFLINGMSHPAAGLNPVNATAPVNVGERLLIRFVNAGAETHMPQLLGDYMTVVAEDGNPLKYPVQRYTVELTSAKTIDAIYAPTAPGSLPILDGRLRLSNAGASPGGMLAYLGVGPGATADTVTIAQLTYDGGAQTLLVIATSSLQAGVTMTAQGFGNLNWNATRLRYQRTFYNVVAQPASVTVTSSGGGLSTQSVPYPPSDTVTIVRLTYDAGAQTLLVIANSTAEPGVTMRAAGFGNLNWNATRLRYQRTFYNVVAQPASVTVTSSGGGSATQNVPFP